jgi:hypothetical protein
MIESKSYGLQNETRQYLRRLYSYGRELNSSDVADIDNFIKGLKQLNLWHSVICWPMRSIHNIGVSSIVVSLGGLGIYNGTLVNSPTWSSAGINSTAIGQCMTTTLRLLNLLTTVASYKVNVDSGIMSRIISSSASGAWFATNRVGSGELNGVNGTVTFSWGAGLTIGIPTFDAVIFGSSTRGVRNKTLGTLTTALYPAAGDGNIGLFRPSGNFINATVSIMMAANRQLTTTEVTLLNDLYKTTIGKGLGLP